MVRRERWEVVTLVCPREGLPTITEQGTELAKAFNFWPSPESRAGSNVYDIRWLILILSS